MKVQLDDEYSLTVKLPGRPRPRALLTMRWTPERPARRRSGSQSPVQIRTLCKALLLRSQMMYHNHCTKTRAVDTVPDDDGPAFGLKRIKKKYEVPSPSVLQSCASLECKLIFEKKIRCGEPRSGQGDGRTPLPVTTSFLGGRQVGKSIKEIEAEAVGRQQDAGPNAAEPDQTYLPQCSAADGVPSVSSIESTRRRVQIHIITVRRVQS